MTVRSVEDVVKGVVALPGAGCSGSGGSECFFVRSAETAANHSLDGSRDHFPGASGSSGDCSVFDNGVDDAGGDGLMAGEVRVIVAGICGHGVSRGSSVCGVAVDVGLPVWEFEDAVVHLGWVDHGLYVEEGISSGVIVLSWVPVVGDWADGEDGREDVGFVKEAALNVGVKVLLDDPVGSDDLVGEEASLGHVAGVLWEEAPLWVGFFGPQVRGGVVVPEVRFGGVEEDEEGGVVVINMGFSQGVVRVSADGRRDWGLVGEWGALVAGHAGSQLLSVLDTGSVVAVEGVDVGFLQELGEVGHVGSLCSCGRLGCRVSHCGCVLSVI